MTERMPAARRPHVALFPWGSVVEDFLRPIGLDRRAFATGMSGGWLFGYAEAIRRRGIATTIVCFSSEVTSTERLINPSTGMATVFLPPSRVYRRLRRWPGDADDPCRPGGAGVIPRLVRYAATPAGVVMAALRAEGCTAILAQEYEHPRFDILIGVGRRLGLPVYATFQGAPPPATRFERRIRRSTIRRASALVAASVPEADRVRRTYGLPADRVVTIPNPLDLDMWRPASRRECRASMDLPETAAIVVCHGRIDMHRKGLDVLLEAWRGLVSAHPHRDLRLHLIGAGRDDAWLAGEMAARPVPGLRWVHRYVNDRAELCRELGAADSYVMASRHEGFPVAPLEALACGLPVVAADAPGIAEIFPHGEGDGGIVVPIGDAPALRRALERLLLDSDVRSRLASRARQRVEELCSLEVVGTRLAALLGV